MDRIRKLSSGSEHHAPRPVVDVPTTQRTETHLLDSPSAISPLQPGGTPGPPSADGLGRLSQLHGTRRAHYPCTSPMTPLLSHYFLSATECRPPLGTGTNQTCAFVLQETGYGRIPAGCPCCRWCRGGTRGRDMSGQRKSPFNIGQPGRASLPGDGEAGPAASQGKRSSGRGLAHRPQSQGQSGAGRPQRAGSAGGLVAARWDVHAGSASGGPARVPFPPRTRDS